MRVIPAGASWRLLLAATLAGLSACGDVPTEPSADVPASESLSPVPRSHQALARMVAHALRDPQLRAELHASLRSSPVFEDKVHLLGHLARAEGAPLLSRMAASPAAQATGIRSAEGVLDLVRSFQPMEIYFPVTAHRAQWDGSENLIVAVGMEEEERPFGVTLGGEPVMLSAEAPPSVPTLVITPAEAFGELGQPIASSLKPKPGLARQSEAPQQTSMGSKTWQRGKDVYEFYEWVRATQWHEAWWKGAPEFQIFLMGTNDTDRYAELNTKYEIPSYVWPNTYATNEWQEMPDRQQMIYWKNFGTRIRSRCWERDSGNTYNLGVGGATLIYGVDVNFSGSLTITDKDDDCGYNYIVARKSDGTWTRVPTRSSTVLNQAGSIQWAGYGWVQ